MGVATGDPQPKLDAMRATPPGPPPVTNNPLSLLRYARAFQADPIKFVGDRFKKYGDVYYTVFRGTPLYIFQHPEHMREILVTKGQSFGKPTTGLTAAQLKRFLGQGLVTSNGDLWRKQRRMINPAFARRRLMALAPHMTELAAECRETWAPGQTMDVATEMMSLTLGIVTRALFAQDSSGNEHDVATALDTFREAASSPALLPEWTPLPRYRRIRQGRRAMDRIVYGMIDERAAESREALETRPDLLSTLILMTDDGGADSMTRQQLRDEILTLFLAGHETTSQTLTWTWYLLSQNPEVEARLHQELSDVLGGRLPTADDELPLTDRILTESMRVFPPVTTVPRVAVEEVQVGEWSIPKGADVICWTYMAQHDPRWFEDPERFDPDRWLPERAATGT